jgi:hypothetical protein
MGDVEILAAIGIGLIGLALVGLVVVLKVAGVI